jgi:DNA-binding NarL/FixJ family response regulator
MRRMLAYKPDSRVLMFSMYEDLIYADRALKAGACGYVTKASAPNVLVEAVHAIALGKKYVSPDIAQRLAQERVAADSEAAGGLSAREFEVLRMLVQGLSIRDIAAAMGLNPKTVANHQWAIRQKLGANTAVQLAQIGSALLADRDKQS